MPSNEKHHDPVESCSFPFCLLTLEPYHIFVSHGQLFLEHADMPCGSDSWRRHRRRSRSLHWNHVSSSGRKAAAPSSRALFNGPPPAPRRADALGAPLPSGAARRAVNRFLSACLDSSRTGRPGSGTARARSRRARARSRLRGRCGGPWRFQGPMVRIGDGREPTASGRGQCLQRDEAGDSDGMPPGPRLRTGIRAGRTDSDTD